MKEQSQNDKRLMAAKSTTTRPTVFRSTKGASRMRRSCINREIVALRELLPVAECTKQRLSQLQTICLSCVYIRKSHYFERLLPYRRHEFIDPAYDFSQAIPGFIMVMSTDGRLLFVSDNVADYLGHSSIDMLSQGDRIYDVTDRRDHATWRMHLQQRSMSAVDICGLEASGSCSTYSPATSFPADCCRFYPETVSVGTHRVFRTSATSSDADRCQGDVRSFFCRMFTARTCRRLTTSGCNNHKMIFVRGHFTTLASPLDVIRSPANQQRVFVAVCCPAIGSAVKDGGLSLLYNTFAFVSVHSLDMKYLEVSHVGQYYLGCSELELMGKSWYELLHPDDLQRATEEHRRVLGRDTVGNSTDLLSTVAASPDTTAVESPTTTMSIRQQTASGRWLSLHVSLTVHHRSTSDVGTTVSATVSDFPSTATALDNGNRQNDKFIVCTSHVIADGEPPLTGSNQFKPVSRSSVAATTSIVGPHSRPGGKSVIVSARQQSNSHDIFRSHHQIERQYVSMAKTESAMTSSTPNDAILWQPVDGGNYGFSTCGSRVKYAASSDIECGVGGHVTEFSSWSPWVAEDHRQTTYAASDFVVGGLGRRYGMSGDHSLGWSTMNGCRRQTGHVVAGDAAGITYG